MSLETIRGNMEGRGGRRIFGTVRRGVSITQFTLVLETREGNLITSTFRASNEDLEQWPLEYNIILDKMVEQIDQELNLTEGEPS
jgi:hypothetical protein